MFTLLPAFGRDYTSKAKALADYVAGKDFIDARSRLACGIDAFEGEEVILRYKNLTQTAHVTLKDIAKERKRQEEERAARPKPALEFEDWLAKVDNCLIEAIELGKDDLPDQDYWSAWDAGLRPSQFAAQILTEEFGI